MAGYGTASYLLKYPRDVTFGNSGVWCAVDAGLIRVGFVTGRKRAIEDHFDKNYELEDQIRGTGKEDLIQPTRDLIQACEFLTPDRRMKGLVMRF